MDNSSRISYLCGRCKYSDDLVCGTCTECFNGSKFIEQRKRPTDRFAVNYYAEQRTVNPPRTLYPNPLGIEKVVFNPPATVVFWANGDKTVVKCSPGEPFDPEKGMAMAISKRALGFTGQKYHKVFKQWAGEYEKQRKEHYDFLSKTLNLPEDEEPEHNESVFGRYIES